MRSARWLLAGVLMPIAASAQPLPENLDGIQTLTVEQAEGLAKKSSYYGGSLSSLSTITADVAEALATWKADLRLRGLADISADAAASLAKHKRGGLELGLRTVSTEVAEALSRHEGEWLCLPELTMLSDAQAEAFGKHGGRQLILGGLATLSPEQAAALAKHGGSLALGVAAITPEAAVALATHRGPGLTLGLTTISDDVVAALASRDGDLSLPGLATISEADAKALAQHKGRLKLDGLTALSNSAAMELARHEGSLSLDGLAAISDEVASALASQTGGLSLGGLTSLTDGQAEALATCKGGLNLDGVASLSDDQAAALAKVGDKLMLDGLRKVSHKAASALAASGAYFQPAAIVLSNDIRIARKATQQPHRAALAASQPEQAELQEAAEGKELHSPDIEEVRERIAADPDAVVDMSHLKSLDAEAAEALVCDDEAPRPVHRRRTVRYRLRMNEREDAEEREKLVEFTAHVPGRALYLNGLETLPQEVASMLGGHVGDLQINGVREVSPEVAQELAWHRGLLSLDGVETLSVEAAGWLASHDGPVSLRGIQWLSSEAYRALVDSGAATHGRRFSVRLPAEILIASHFEPLPFVQWSTLPAKDTLANYVKKMSEQSDAEIEVDTAALERLQLSDTAMVSAPMGTLMKAHEDPVENFGGTEATVKVPSTVARIVVDAMRIDEAVAWLAAEMNARRPRHANDTCVALRNAGNFLLTTVPKAEEMNGWWPGNSVPGNSVQIQLPTGETTLWLQCTLSPEATRLRAPQPWAGNAPGGGMGLRAGMGAGAAGGGAF